MDKRTVVFFKNTCRRCFNDIEIPLLGDFAYGEFIFQTADGQDFLVAQFINNKTEQEVGQILSDKTFDLYKIMSQLADKKDNKEFSTVYPICPKCKKTLSYYTDNTRTIEKEADYVTWTGFQSKDKDKKREIVLGLLNKD